MLLESGIFDAQAEFPLLIGTVEGGNDKHRPDLDQPAAKTGKCPSAPNF